MIIPKTKRPWIKNTSQGVVYTDGSFYRTPAWRALRARKMDKDPICVVCGKIGQMVDHKQPITLDGAPLDINNLQTMCNHCHNVKRAKEKNAKYSKR